MRVGFKVFRASVGVPGWYSKLEQSVREWIVQENVKNITDTQIAFSNEDDIIVMMVFTWEPNE